MKIQLLDCTLRDGGYVNDWKYGLLTIRSIIRRLDVAGIDIIECGFLDSRCEYDNNRTLFPNIPSIAKTIGSALPKRAMLVAMIDYGTFDENLLIPKSESVLDGIRLIFKKENIETALEQARKIKELGYKLFLNPVALTSYRPVELLQLVEKINEISPFAMSIVDTYGLMFESDVKNTIAYIDGTLRKDIGLGYHCHNNLDMANANCVTYINQNMLRNRIVDSTVLGMGKNAGNAGTEIIAQYLLKQEIKDFDINQILDCAYTDILKFQSEPNWGYKLDNFLSAINDCSPNWIKYLMAKNTLSVQGINTILQALPYEKREVSYFSKEVAEQKYAEYMNKYVDDTKYIERFKFDIGKREILLLCPGKTLKTYSNIIKTYIKEKNPIVITVNFISTEFISDYAFITNSNRYSQMLGLVSEIDNLPTILVTSNIVTNESLLPEFIFNYEQLYNKVNGDNSVCLLIALLKNININCIAVAGLDGFNKDTETDNFFNASMNLVSSSDNNSLLIEQLKQTIDNTVNIDWITPSKVKELL